MIQLNKHAVLMLLKDIKLSQHIATLPIQGLLENTVKGVIPYTVLVDQWPVYNTIILKPPPNQNPPVYRLGIHSKSAKDLQRILTHPKFLPTTIPVRIYGLQKDFVETLETVADTLGMTVKFLSKTDPRNIVTMNAENVWSNEEMVVSIASTIKTLLPDIVYLDNLDPEKHMNEIVASWKTYNWSEFYSNDEEGIAATKYYLERGPSVGAFLKTDSSLVGWVMADLDRSGLMGITYEKYRNTLITQCVHMEYCRLKLLMGEYYWGYLAKSNSTSKNFLSKFGTINSLYTDTDFVHCILRPKVSKL